MCLGGSAGGAWDLLWEWLGDTCVWGMFGMLSESVWDVLREWLGDAWDELGACLGMFGMCLEDASDVCWGVFGACLGCI